MVIDADAVRAIIEMDSGYFVRSTRGNLEHLYTGRMLE